jgi:hypothetical protein
MKCGEKFHGECPYNRICEEWSSANEKIALRTFCVSSNPLDEEGNIMKIGIIFIFVLSGLFTKIPQEGINFLCSFF